MRATAQSTTITAIGALTLCLAFALTACGKGDAAAEAEKPKAAAKALSVKVETVKRAPLALSLALTGSVEAGRIAQLASPVEGPVICCLRLREGDTVKKGQVMLTLGHTEGVDALLASLQEDLKKEEDNLARTRRLVETGALPAEQLDIAAANVARIRAQLTKTRETTQDYVIRAPWAGVVSKMKVRDGDFVGPRAPLAEVYDPDSLMVRVAVPEQASAGLTKGMTVEVELDAYPGKRFGGTISRLYPSLDPRTRTRTVEIGVNAAPALLPGMFARVKLLRETIPDAITVPAHSLVAMPGGGKAVFVMQEGRAVRSKVETGVEVEGRVRILAGLAAGDALIVGGHENLKDGAAVQVAKSPAPGGEKKPAEAATPAAKAEKS